MENFFWEDDFFGDLEDLILSVSEEDDLSDLDDDWKIECMSSILEPVFVLSPESIMKHVDEERLGEDGIFYDRCYDYLKSKIDFDSINSGMPKIYYPGGEDFTITKQDLLDYIKE